MAKFNKTASRPLTATTNFAGGDAYQESPKLELASILLASFVTDEFYRSGNATIERIRALIAMIQDREFSARAALLARREYGMRTVSHIVAGEVAHLVKGAEWPKRFYAEVVQRPDDATEIAAYYLGRYGKPFPNSLKKGLALGLRKFDGYQLAKYRAANTTLKLVDLVNIAHPKPVERNAEAFRKLVADELRSDETWETKLTRAGQAADSDEEKLDLKREAWASLLAERKLGYFALLRNLRNILESAPESLPAALALLVDEGLIARFRVLPFRFVTAYRELQSVSGTSEILTALGQAAELSLRNVPEFSGATLVALDVSGSMRGRPFEIGSLFAAALARRDGADVLVFSEKAEYHNLPNDLGLFGGIESLRSVATWGGTNFHAVFEKAARPYDRIIILSDMQAWMGQHTPAKPFAQYRERTGAAPKVFTFDLQGLGTLQFPEQDVFALAGWSDRAFEVMKLLETDRNALLRQVEAVTF
jgi:hypothetical protein